MKKQIPNILTLTRIALIPVVIFLLYLQTSKAIYYSFWIYLIAVVTDFLDGFLARRYNLISDIGKLLDPLADKILNISVLIVFVGLRDSIDASPWVASWIVVLLVAREIWVTGIRAVAASRGVIFEASWLGKIKTVLQVIGISFLFIHSPIIYIFNYHINGQLIGESILIISLIAGYISGINYSYTVLTKMNYTFSD